MSSDVAVLLLNFGEPEEASPEAVTAFLERIFLANAGLEPGRSEAAARRRSRELAERRAPGLIEEYGEIGGSPLNRQARAQAEALGGVLADRGLEVRTYVGMQFTDPFIGSAVRRAVADGATRLIGLPLYPLCGRSTTVAALEELRSAVASIARGIELQEISGWHRHPGYLDLRAANIREFARRSEVELSDRGTRLVFSAHGTPLRYLGETRYVEYVEDCCRAIAGRLGLSEHTIAYQNHSNRAIDWTEPDIEDAVRGLPADPAGVRRIVVEPISFMHEQSETLAELDHDLRGEAESGGLEFHRVPVPHDDPRFIDVLADLVEPFVGGDPGRVEYRACLCRRDRGTLCLNAASAP